MIRIAFILILLNSSCAATRNLESKTVIWETEFYSIVTNKDSLLSVIKADINRYKKFPESVKEKYEAGFYSDNENIFQSSSDDEKYLLEGWTGTLYRKKLITVINKKNQEVEKNIIDKEYSDVGTSGIKVFANDLYLFKIIEIVF